jgi:hypothetical protein
MPAFTRVLLNRNKCAILHLAACPKDAAHARPILHQIRPAPLSPCGTVARGRRADRVPEARAAA